MKIITSLGVIALYILVIGLTIVVMKEIDKHYVEPDWSKTNGMFDCPPGYYQDGGFGCMAYNPAQMGADGIHNLLLYWPELLILSFVFGGLIMILDWFEKRIKTKKL